MLWLKQNMTQRVTQGGEAVGDRLLAKKLEEAQGLNQGLKEANASFNFY
jgi:hypothetical protein